MHEIQRSILALARLENVDDMSYRQIAERIGCNHASQVKHHLAQLMKYGYLVRNSSGQLLVVPKANKDDSNLLTIPIMGEADCGEATRFATDEMSGYLTVSPSIIGTSDLKGLYALRAKGNSMNNARIAKSKAIEDGDYVLVAKAGESSVYDGDYVVSNIQGLANIKRLKIDKHNNRVVLYPESFEDYDPIIISEDDLDSFKIMGKVIDVIKRV